MFLFAKRMWSPLRPFRGTGSNTDCSTDGGTGCRVLNDGVGRIISSCETDSGEVVCEGQYAFLDFVNCLPAWFPAAMKIMPQLGLANAGDAFEAGQAESLTILV